MPSEKDTLIFLQFSTKAPLMWLYHELEQFYGEYITAYLTFTVEMSGSQGDSLYYELKLFRNL